MILKRVISFFLAFIIGFTSLGFSADLHFCKGHLKSIAIFGTAKSCHEISQSSCHNNNSNSTEQLSCEDETDQDCCKNERFTDSFEFDAPLVFQIVDYEESNDFDIEIFTVNSFFKYQDLSFLEPKSKPPNFEYSIPLSGVDIRIVYQSFLC